MITAVVPISPIKSHPDTVILAETVESIRHWLPTAEIFLTFDGVRKEQAKRRTDYEEFIRRALELADWKWRNVVPFIFDEHQHQTGMLRSAIDEIRTPLLMYVEQDTPLVTDEPIDFDVITDTITAGQSNLVRLYHEGVLQPEHQHLMHGFEMDADDNYDLFIRTSQWSQRPHIASVAYYRRILDAHFTPGARSFIEDKMHSVLDEAYRVDDLLGWMQHRVHIYNPAGDNKKRSYHTDGRAGEPKWDDRQVF